MELNIILNGRLRQLTLFVRLRTLQKQNKCILQQRFPLFYELIFPFAQVHEAKSSTRIVAKEWLLACSASGKREEEDAFTLVKSTGKADSKAASGSIGSIARAPTNATSPLANPVRAPPSKRLRPNPEGMSRNEVAPPATGAVHPRHLTYGCRRERR